MTQPTNYTPTTDFSQQESINASGRSTVNTAALDAEFANIETTLDQTVSNLSLIQRDDGRLADLSVDVYTLTRQVLNLIGGYSLKGAWQPSTSYAEKDIVDNAGVLYLCVASHASTGSFVEDGNWSRFGFSGGEDAAASAAMASVSAASADSSEAGAIAAAAEAAASAISAWSARSAAVSAQGAAASASGSASTSASNAANSAAAAALSAASVARPIPIAEGGTGTTTAALAIAALGGVASATLSASSGAAQVGTIQTGSGVVLRTAQDKLRELVSVEDFGAAGDGVANDSPAFSSAFATGSFSLIVPDGTYKLDSNVTRPNNVVLKASAGATFTGAGRILGSGVALGETIPQEVMYGKLVIRDENRDVSVDHPDGFASHPNMGQALRVDATQEPGQCTAFLSGDQRQPVIGAGAYVGLHSRHNNSMVTPQIWGFNPVVVKDVTNVESPTGGTSTIGVEISVSNNTVETTAPLTSGEVTGLFCSYIHTANTGSAAISVGGLHAGVGIGWTHGLWIDGITTTGTHIRLSDEVSGNAGVKRGVDFSQVSQYSEAAILLGNLHVVRALSTSATQKLMLYINGSDEAIIGDPSLPVRIPGSTVILGNASGHNVRPNTDNLQSLGTAGNRWSVVYAGTGAINTSDSRDKQQVAALTVAERAVAVRIKELIRTFKFNDAVAEKGAAARIHCGVRAQDVKAAFTAEGLVAEKYALFCYDEWAAQPEVTGADGEILQPARSAGNRYGVRYEELMAFIIGAM